MCVHQLIILCYNAAELIITAINISSLDCGQCLSAQATTLDYPLLITGIIIINSL